MPEVGIQGQKKLKAASVLLIGTGGLGSPLALYLAAAGIGRMGLVDYDVVDETNLQRQVIHFTSDVGKSKLESATAKLSDINPYLVIEKHNVPLTSDNALDILKDYDIIIDGPITSPHVIWSTMPACCWASPMRTAAFSALRVSSPCFTPRKGRATAACSQSRRPQDWYQAAPKVAC